MPGALSQAMSSEWITSTHNFRGQEFSVSLRLNTQESIELEVENKGSIEQWRSTFDTSYVEDLTQKTGNFKQFGIFVSMLESAILKNNPTVSLDLLTYSDLESLRQKKAGTTRAPGSNGALQNKRYLILTYTVEFDRIHYPLPLAHAGSADRRWLQSQVQRLEAEVKELKLQNSAPQQTNQLYKQLRHDYELLIKEKEELEAEFLQFRREIKNTSVGAAAKEIRVLKAAVKGLEQELLRERTKQQRKSTRRSQQNRDLVEEVEELRASERNLRARLKSVTNELATYKRDVVHRPAARLYSSQRSSRQTSQERRRPLSASRGSDRRSNSLDRKPADDRERARERLYGSTRASRLRANSLEARQARSGSLDRYRSPSEPRCRRPLSARSDRSSERRPLSARSDKSTERRSLSARSDRSADRSWNSIGSPSPSPRTYRGRSPSPRFDPSQYVKDKARKQRETDLRRKREVKARISGRPPSRPNSRPNSRPGSATGRRVNSSTYSGLSRGMSDLSAGSASDNSDWTDYSEAASTASRTRRSRQHRRPVNPKTQDIWNDRYVSSKPDSARSVASSRKKASTLELDLTESPLADQQVADSDAFDRSAEMSEIDARLNRLQEFMKANLT